MGVAGSGKTLIGKALADRLGAVFVEGDALQPPENVARMAGGQPLTDAHRAGWLDAVAAAVGRANAEGRDAVAACSALKRIYRDRLRGQSAQMRFVHLSLDSDTARLRVASRTNHFMPASLVDSQFADLQPLQPDESGVVVDATMPAERVVDAAMAWISQDQPVR
ncbi:MAG: gluconokinase [Rhizobiaceae bacterium]|nr:gluconokinase [Rhizobiaceae bacterium]